MMNEDSGCLEEEGTKETRGAGQRMGRCAAQGAGAGRQAGILWMRQEANPLRALLSQDQRPGFGQEVVLPLVFLLGGKS